MFCKNCGELVLENNNICPACGAEQNKTNPNDNIAVVYASQKEDENIESAKLQNNFKLFLRYGIFELVLAVLSFVFLSFNYMSVSIDLLYGGSSDSSFTGYGLIECLGGRAWLSGLMSILLIILNITTILFALLKIRGKFRKKQNKIISIKNVLYLVATIVQLVHISFLLSEFDSSLTTTNIGLGCVLNIGVALILLIVNRKQKHI